MRKSILLAVMFAAFFCSCKPNSGAAKGQEKSSVLPPPQNQGLLRAFAALETAPIAPERRAAIRERIQSSPGAFLSRIAAVEAERRADPELFRLVDKTSLLPEDYVPGDLANLDGSGASVSRAGFKLRQGSLGALLAMDEAARVDGILLLVGSSYRSFEYQKGVFERSVATDGLSETERSIARPGASQHQLGTALDFAPIDDAFADTPAARWLEANADRFGFSLSFPKGAEEITGFRWESWHYRYIGREATALASAYFDGAQHDFLAFLTKY